MANWLNRILPVRGTARVFHLTPFLKNEDDQSSGTNNEFVGNPYRSYARQVKITSDMYEGIAEWGCQATKNIIDIRASFIIGGGVQPTISNKYEEGDKFEKELKFIKEFISFNDLDGQAGLDWAKEAEIEGKFLCKLSVDRVSKQIIVRFIPWTTTAYHVRTRVDDYQEYESVEYKLGDKDKTIPKDQFVYVKFGGRTHKVNDTPTKIGSVLSKIEALDRALRDLRQINHLFASPTPTFECEDMTAAKELYEMLKQLNWKIGRLLVVGGAKYSMVGPAISSIESLISEITTCAKIISGAVGVPVHFFGFSDLMSNRATADSLMEMVFASTEQERASWINFYSTLFTKAIELYNEKFQDNMDPTAVVAEVPHSSQTKMRQIIDFWLELLDRKAISLETVLEQVPGVDSKQELSRIEEELKKAEEQMMESLLNAPGSTVVPPGKKPAGEERRMEKRLGRPGD